MPKIGVVLSGCAGKGAYEIGCMLAIREYFGAENMIRTCGSLHFARFPSVCLKPLDHLCR